MHELLHAKCTNFNCLFIRNYISGNCTTNGGPSPNVPCIFPFIIDGITYNQCPLDSDGYWCSTKVDHSGIHIAEQGNWGTCDQECPGVTGKWMQCTYYVVAGSYIGIEWTHELKNDSRSFSTYRKDPSLCFLAWTSRLWMFGRKLEKVR